MTRPADYPLPDEVVGLTGTVDRVEPGTLPLRGDLAHIALATRFLAAHYVVPFCRTVGPDGVTLKLAMREDAGDGVTIAAGETVELLDCAGDWGWVTLGPDGPSGYLRLSSLEPDSE